MPSYRRDYGPQGCFKQGGTSLLFVLTLFAAVLTVVRPRRKRGVR
jgi:hypothetical protein